MIGEKISPFTLYRLPARDNFLSLLKPVNMIVKFQNVTHPWLFVLSATVQEDLLFAMLSAKRSH